MGKYLGILFFSSFIILGIVATIGAFCDGVYVASGMGILFIMCMVMGFICEIKDWKWMNR